MLINYQKLAALMLCFAAAAFLCACGSAAEIELPPLPTYSDETPAPTPTATVSAVPEVKPELTAAPESESAAPVSPAPEPTQTASPTPVPTAKPDVPNVSISGETLPDDMVQYNVATLHGVVSSDLGNISLVRAFLYDGEGNEIQSCYFQPMQASFSLAGTVNAQLQFAVLQPGDYIYALYADVEYKGKTYQRELIYHNFSVYSSQEQMEIAQSGIEDFDFTAKITQDTSNAGIIWNFLIAYLNNPYGAAGVLANIEIESGCEPTRVQGDYSEGFVFSADYTSRVDEGSISKDSFVQAIAGDGYGSGYGLCQWSFDRKEGLYELAQENGTSVGDLNTQCTYLIMELEIDYPELSKLLKSTDDARKAAREFAYVFEQPGEMGNRAGIAEDYLIRFAS